MSHFSIIQFLELVEFQDPRLPGLEFSNNFWNHLPDAVNSTKILIISHRSDAGTMLISLNLSHEAIIGFFPNFRVKLM